MLEQSTWRVLGTWVVTVDDLARVGGKAVNLGELLRAGFDVPGGFSMTTAAFTRVIGAFDGDVLAALDGLATDDLDQVRAAGRDVRSCSCASWPWSAG